MVGISNQRQQAGAPMRKLALAFVAGVIGCSDAVGPSQPPFQLSYTVGSQGTDAVPTVTATSSGIVVKARIVTPTPCTDLSASVNSHDTQVDITVTATQRQVACVQSLGVFDYTLVLSPVAGGAYHVVVNQVGEAGAAHTTFSGDVTVGG